MPIDTSKVQWDEGSIDPAGIAWDEPTATPAPRPKSSGFRRTLGDTAVDLGKGVIGVGEAVVGVGNLVTGGNVGKALEAVGYDPATSKRMLEEGYTHERVAANKAVADADGFVDTAKAMIANPSTILGAVVESAPLMIGGGAVARGGAAALSRVGGSLGQTGFRRTLAAIPHTTAGKIGLAAAGEGVVGAGAAAEQLRQGNDDRLLDTGDVVASLGSGAGTAVLGAIGGGIARRLGIADVDVAAAGGSTVNAEARKNILRRATEGMLAEGVFEELPQSAQEQMWQNYATDRPLMEGVGSAAAAGALTGGVMGGGFAAFSRAPRRLDGGKPAPAAPPEVVDPVSGATAPIPDAANGPTSHAVNIGVQNGAVATTANTVAEADLFAASIAAASQPAGKEAQQRRVDDGGFRRTLDERARTAQPQVDPATGEILTPVDDDGRPARTSRWLDDAGVPRAPSDDELGAFMHETMNAMGAYTGVNRGKLYEAMRAEDGALQRDQLERVFGVVRTERRDGLTAPRPTAVLRGDSTGNAAYEVRDFDTDLSEIYADTAATLDPAQADAHDERLAPLPNAAPQQSSGQGSTQPAALDLTSQDDRAAAALQSESALLQEPGAEASGPSVTPLGSTFVEPMADVPAPALSSRPADIPGQARNESGQELVAPASTGPEGSTPRAPAPPAQTSSSLSAASPSAQDAPATDDSPITAAEIELPSDTAPSKDFPYGRGERAGSLYNQLAMPNGAERGVRDTGWETDPLREQMQAELDAGKHGGMRNGSGPDPSGMESFEARYDELLRERYAAQVNARTNATQAPKQAPVNTRLPSASNEDGPAGSAVQVAAAQAATSPDNDLPTPTVAQVEAGNFKVGRTKINGLDISIEHPAGVKRKATHSKKLRQAYGYIRRTEGADGEHFDVFLGDRADDTSLPVFVVDQKKADGSFDESKGMLGFADEASARAAYLSNYPKGWEQSGYGGIKQMSQDEFKAWVRDTAATKKPVSGLTSESGPVNFQVEPTQKESAQRAVNKVVGLIADGTHPSEIVRTLDEATARQVAIAVGVRVSKGTRAAVVANKLSALPQPDLRKAAEKAFAIAASPEEKAGAAPLDAEKWNALSESTRRSVMIYEPSWLTPRGNVAKTASWAGVEWDRIPASIQTKLIDAYQLREEAHGRRLAQAKPEPVTNTEDAGEELWYNRRNRTGDGVRWTDVEGLNATLKAKEAVKSKVWPRPDYDAMVADGLHPILARQVKLVYDAIAAKPATGAAPTDQQLQAYIEGMHKVRAAVFAWVQVLNKPANHAAFESDGVALGQLLQDHKLIDGIFPGEHMRRFSGDAGRANNEMARLLGNRKLISAVQPNQADFKKAREAVADGWPKAQEPWERLYKIRQFGGLFSVIRAGRAIARSLATHETAVDAAKKHYEETKAKGGDRVSMAEESIAVQRAVRTGAARRAPDEDITSDRLQETFGFRGINFGNWMKGKAEGATRERQLHLNHTYDGFHDLADLLGIPPKALSLNGMLGIAFGAQGSGGRGAAHFVPGVNEINLTREYGVGALAHEWGHALDHYFAVQAGDRYAKSLEPYMSHIVDGGVPVTSDSIRPEIVQAFRSLVTTMTKRPMTQAERDAAAEKSRTRARSQVDGWIRQIRGPLERRLKPDAKERALEEFDTLAARIRAGDLGDGRVGASTTFGGYSPAVEAVRNLVKDETGRVPSVDDMRALSSNADHLAYLLDERRGNKAHEAQLTRSEYLQNAGTLDASKTGMGKGYWSMRTELLARAFQSYVLDKLAQRDGRNDYLTRPQMDEATTKAAIEAGLVTADRYPRGAERQAINAAFDTMASEFKTREEGARVALFSRAEEPAITAEDRAAQVRGRRQLRGITRTSTASQIEAGIKAQEKIKARLRDLEPVAKPSTTEAPETAHADGVAEFWQALTAGEGIFEYGMPPEGAKDLQAIADGIFDPGKNAGAGYTFELAEQADENGVSHGTLATPRGHKGTFELEKDGALQLHISNLEQGEGEGRALYMIFNTWAARNGYRALPDRGGLTPINAYRRTQIMASSAIRDGGTAHLMPADSQRLPHWRAGDFGKPPTAAEQKFNTGYLFIKGAAQALNNVPLLDRVRFNFETSRFEDTKGREFTDDDFDALLSQLDAGKVGVGRRSAQRAVLTSAVLRELDGLPVDQARVAGRRRADDLAGTRPDVLGDEAGELRGQSSLDGVLYSRDEGGAGTGAPRGRRDPAPALDETPPNGGVSASGLSMDVGQRLKTELTAKWGENAPRVLLVESDEELAAAARRAGAFRTSAADVDLVEGMYLGQPTVWINLSQIRTEERFAQVLAHEAIGHYGVERVVGRGEWRSIVAAITGRVLNNNGSADMKAAIEQLRRTQPKIFTITDKAERDETIAKEVIAVMAERGSRNGLVLRVAAAVRRFLRRMMPTLKWSDAEIRDLINKADRFMHAGRTNEQRQATARAYAFSRGEPARPAYGSEEWSELLDEILQTDGSPIADAVTANKLWGNGQRIFAMHENADTAIEVTSHDMLEAYAPDQLMALPRALAAEAGLAEPPSGGVLFSKAPADAIESIEQQIRQVDADVVGDQSVLGRARAALASAEPKKVKDATRTTWLGALTLRHLVELGGDYFPTMRIYGDFMKEMEADRNQLQQEGEDVAEAARKWAGKNLPEAARTFDLMHDATIAGTDPAEGYQPLKFRQGGKLVEVNKKNVTHHLKILREQMRGRGGDSKKNILDEARGLKAMLAAEPKRKAAYPALVARWNALSPEAKAQYIAMRDLYAKRSEQTEEALVQRIKDLKMEGGENHKRALITTIRHQFETQRLQGVYFPLQRFDRYFVAAEKDGTPTFQMFESINALETAVKSLQAKGFTITARGLKSDGKAKDAPSGTFVAEVLQMLNKAGVSDQTQDQIYQMYLQALPELSMRKHSIHRKAVIGFDSDAIRGFAFNMQHGAHQLARLRYAHKLQDTITGLQEQQKANQKKPDADTRRIVAGDAVLAELDKRHEWISNPTDSGLTNLVSSFGFTYYLGLTPAAALVNLTQTALISYPYLASRYGPVKAMNQLLRGMSGSARRLGHINKDLAGDELRAHQVLQKMGALDKTQTHNLAGIAEGGLSGYNPKWAKAMEIIGWGFHKTEVINREATGMAAFRLATEDGASFDEAVKIAADTIHDTHYDYSNANRARFMQSGTAKVLLMFRQYSLNTTWHLGRMVWNATKGADPEVKRIARRNLTGILGMSALFSGALGLPLASVTMGVLNALAASAGDDDEPWDAETEFRKFLEGMFGVGTAAVILGGVANPLTGADIASRVSLSQLWFRDADRELDGRGAYYNLLEQAAGPMGGVLKNALVGKQMIDEGHLMRGVETMLPKSLKDMVKAARYSAQGVSSLRGDAIVEDLSVRQLVLQLGGFTPAEVADRYDRNRALKNYEQHVLDRRQYLVDAVALSVRTGDADGRRDAMASIRVFNRKWPELAITPKTLRKSLRTRARYSREAERGIVLNKKIAARVREEVGVE